MLKNLLNDDDKAGDPDATLPDSGAKGEIISLFDQDDGKRDEPFILSEAPPDSLAETARRSGLAWSAGIVFFAAVLFMLIIGWGADLLFGTSPWGMVAGIVIGSLIGFIQFFRLTSQIFKQ
ncbi:MAG: AtpZ/AtpI family protein [Acidobacteriota bacterium]